MDCSLRAVGRVAISFCVISAVLFATACGQSTTQSTTPDLVSPRHYSAVILLDAHHPNPERSIVEAALSRSEQMIFDWYGQHINISIEDPITADSCLQEMMGPARIPENWLAQLYKFGRNDTIARFLEGIDETDAIRRFSSEAISEALTLKYRTRLGSPIRNAQMMFDLYAQQVGMLESIHIGRNLLLDPRHWQRNSYSYWEAAFCNVDPHDTHINVIIMNSPLIGDQLRSSPVHSLVRGGLLNGFAMVASQQVLISTFPIFSDDPTIAALRDGYLSDSERVQALAQVIAHELGAHVIMKWNDAYGHTGCLAEPVRGMEYRRTMSRLLESKCNLEHAPLDLNDLLGQHFAVMASCLAAGGDTNAALRAILRGLQSDSSSARLRHLRLQLSQTVSTTSDENVEIR